MAQAFRSKLKLRALACAALIISLGHAHASSELDRRYALESVGALKSVDNVDGLFTDYVSQAIRQYFQGHPRFLLQDLSRSDAVLESAKIPYAKLIDDEKVLSKIAHATRSTTLIRTKIFREGTRYRFTLDWLIAPRMELLASEVFFLDEPERGQALGSEEIKGQLEGALERLVKKVPFMGQVSGRDQATVTLNIGEELGLRKGDILVVGTLEEVKRHPLLKTIAEWRTSQTGKLEVEQVDRTVTFARITEEDPARPVARYNKLLSVLPKADPLADSAAQPSAPESPIAALEQSTPPRIGWVSGGFLASKFGRQSADSTGTSGKTGGGYAGGARADAQIWLDRQWFVEGMLGYGYSTYSQSDVATGAASSTSSSATFFAQRIGVGYSYLSGTDFFGAKSWVKLGSQGVSYSMPRDATELTNPISFSGFYLGLGGDLPLRDSWGAQLDLNFGLTATATEASSPLGIPLSATMVDFYAGAFKRLKPRMLFRIGFNFTAHGVEYTNGSTLSHSNLALIPSWVMLF